MDPKMIEETARLVAAYVSHNAVSISELPALIQSTYKALTTTGEGTVVVEAQQPAVSVKKSVSASAVICLECGKGQKMLKRHLHTAHDLTPDEYRTKWNLPLDYPMVAPDYAARRSELAKTIGLGKKRV